MTIPECRRAGTRRFALTRLRLGTVAGHDEILRPRGIQAVLLSEGREHGPKGGNHELLCTSYRSRPVQRGRTHTRAARHRGPGEHVLHGIRAKHVLRCGRQGKLLWAGRGTARRAHP
jgi:hypothetical protein